MIRLKIAMTAVICLLGATVAWAQQNGQKSESEQTLKIDTALVSVPVIVSDRQGRYVSGLKASDFTLYEDRIKRRIDFFADTEEPINVALLLDTSRSTVLVLDDIKQAARDFVRQLRAQDHAMIVTFDYDETALCELTGDHKTLEKAIGKARIGERVGTKLRDAVYDVMTEELKSVKGRKAIVVLTDGKDHGSEIGEEALLDGAAEADTLIYSIFYSSAPPGMMRNPTGRGRQGGWGQPRGGRRDGIISPLPGSQPGRGGQRRGRINERNEDAIEFLQELSENSAGRYFNSGVENLKQTFGQIVEELRHQYRLGFYPPENRTENDANAIHRLRVEVARGDLVVRSRRSYRVTGTASGE